MLLRREMDRRKSEQPLPKGVSDARPLSTLLVFQDLAARPQSPAPWKVRPRCAAPAHGQFPPRGSSPMGGRGGPCRWGLGSPLSMARSCAARLITSWWT